MKFLTVKQFCEDKGYKSRADRYRALSDYFGVEGETIKDIISFDRYLRQIYEVDEVGIEKEKEWHTTRPLMEWEWEMKKKMKVLNLDQKPLF